MQSVFVSFPLRERGLKLRKTVSIHPIRVVVPLAGTWIETDFLCGFLEIFRVVPLAGTWIETHCVRFALHVAHVVPLAGTWIETKE